MTEPNSGKIVYCQQWTDGYSLHRNRADAQTFSLNEIKEALELTKELATDAEIPIISNVQGKPFLTRMEFTDCNQNLMNPEARQNCGIRRFDECPSLLDLTE